MRGLPIDLGTIHFVGIGGIGMSGIAEVLHNLGYAVQGSDMAESANVLRLRGLGIDVKVGHKEENLGDAAVVVISSAVKAGNPELDAARQRLMPVVRRAEMLGELMRLKWSIAVGGTHGKTTTTSLVAALLEAAEMDPTVINGGIINAWGTNARLGSGEWMVAEADESDGTFVKLPSTIAVVTNIDNEHMDHYGSFDALREAFVAFVEQIPFYGFATLCIDDAEVQALIPKVSDRKIITYGVSPQADTRVINIATTPDGSSFDIVITDRKSADERVIKQLHLPMVGGHNILNSAAAICIALELGLADEVIREGLANFKGVKRRFTNTGAVDGITIIDDYGHHPVEISAVLDAARSTTPEGRVMAVVQPHRYSRLKDLFEEFCTCFNNADMVVVADIYAAGETPLEGVSQDSLIEGLRSHGHRMVIALEHPDNLAALVDEYMSSGDLVVCLGAGNITQWANALPNQLAEMRNSVAEAGE
ncbi:MAG: UDP-N-acetylmuramate--L-alanine ligase [Rhodospirillaceae bacterium]|jgi:UDP-N-acetylmuramate--alanine ligase|nr:UDP-N-acetylmuramate--L-alanine ligase [Rhodospirillaceae bacterium]MBT4589492.1 UDP-N-acetylmuramate--L-alanine ligase [Rhodospirillaceae bacterium]MBT4937631.1 UDP-N-acetylmuramate--L-alanine ligase [Rhodospirillaceae bacterium]MBT7268238.1 UDP-N-acetylmuramate--L-alanine ligase [Rhodospirillaceae bacterium]